MPAELPVLTGRIVDASVIRRPLALKHPLRGVHGPVTSRSVRLFHVVAEDGTEGVGEGSSVDWLAASRADDSVRWFRAAAEQIRRDKPAASELLRWTVEAHAPASLRAALQTALLDAESQKLRRSVAELLGGSCESLPVSALIGEDTPQAMARQARGYVDRGVCCVKVKVGSGDLELDVARADSVRRAIGGDVGLRLDANGAWTPAQASEALRELAVAAPDFVEEPLKDALEIARLDAPVRVALDESVRDVSQLEAAIARGGWSVVVLKLERTGGPISCLAMAETAMRAGLEVVFTDSIESQVGRAAAVHTAAAAYTRGRGVMHAIGLGGHFLLGDGDGDDSTVHAEGPGLGVDIDAVVSGRGA